MTAAVARFATQDDHLLLDGYARFCHRLELSDRSLRDRLRLARLFLAEHPDLAAWMTRPTRTRLADLHRIKAWPMLSWAALSGTVGSPRFPGGLVTRFPCSDLEFLDLGLGRGRCAAHPLGQASWPARTFCPKGPQRLRGQGRPQAVAQRSRSDL